MIKKIRLIDGFLIVLILSLLLTKGTKAYLDPGSGSYLLQIFLAGFFSIVFALKTFWKEVVAIFKRVFGKNEKNKRG